MRSAVDAATAHTITHLRDINTYGNEEQEAACDADDSERQLIPCLVAFPEDWRLVMAQGLRPEHCHMPEVRAVIQAWCDDAKRGGAIIGNMEATFYAMQESGVLRPAPGETQPAVTWSDITPLFTADPKVADAAVHAYKIVEAAKYRETRLAAFGILTAHPKHVEHELTRLSRIHGERASAPSQPSTQAEDEEPAEPTSPGIAVEQFPLATLPAEIQAFARTVAAAIHCPLDYVAMPLLVYASAAIGNSACMEIKRGWREYPAFWLAIVGDPGDKKSPALAAIHRVIEERQRVLHAAWEANREQRRQEKSDEPEPRLAQLYTSDATIEALGDLLHDNPRGIIVTRDELAGWALAMNEYKRRGADRQHWLSLWSGAALMVNRRSRNRPLYVEHPFVSVVGGIQPDVLGELCDERGRNDGFVHRLLFVYPDRKRRAWTDAEIAEDAYKPLRTLFDSLYERSVDDPLVVTFTSRARDLWRDIMENLYIEAEAPEFPDALRGPWAKLEGYIARLALVVHLMRAAFDSRISEKHCDAESLGAAADIADYLKSHLRRVYARLIARPDDVKLLRIVSWIRDHGGTCTVRDLVRAGVAGTKTTEDAQAALDDIQARGWGHTETTPNAHGRATHRFTLHDPTADKTAGGVK